MLLYQTATIFIMRKIILAAAMFFAVASFAQDTISKADL
jgi:hypothetical protein